jgi:hypothetical protein
MTFEVHKVVDNSLECEKWIGKKVYYSDDLLNLMMYVEGKKEQEPAKVYGKGSATHPFGVEDATGTVSEWKYIYPAEEKHREEKYRPFESVDELVDTFKMHVCNNPKMPPNCMPLVWLRYKGSNSVCMVTGFTDNGVELGGEFKSWVSLLEGMAFFNGYPCGVKVY